MTLQNHPSRSGAEDLVRLLSDHRQLLEAADNEFLDLDLALVLHRKLAVVLDRWDVFTTAQRDHITRTVNYVVATDDEEHDLRSPIGFVDDSEQVEDLLKAVAPDLLT